MQLFKVKKNELLRNVGVAASRITNEEAGV